MLDLMRPVLDLILINRGQKHGEHETPGNGEVDTRDCCCKEYLISFSFVISEFKGTTPLSGTYGSTRTHEVD